ncbi:MAG TPA: hypothetical protein DEF00_03140 [Candidatus Taylorbacteria bacterium]|nr:hypothetical protein [Candidatus Taylorbacteria bacterium]
MESYVGLYTLPQFRGQGFGRAAMEAAIRRMVVPKSAWTR